MPTRVVKFFDAQRGYGFISCEGAPDVFVHYSNIAGSGYRSLEQGQQVEFESSSKSVRAGRVTRRRTYE